MNLKRFLLLILTAATVFWLLFHALNTSAAIIVKNDNRMPERRYGDSSSPLSSEIVLVEGTVDLSQDFAEAISTALSQNRSLLSPTSYYAVTALDKVGASYFVSIVGLELSSDEQKDWNIIDNGIWFGLALLSKGENEKWKASIAGSPDFSHSLQKISDTLLSLKVKKALDPLVIKESTLQEQYIFPWQDGTSMKFGSKGIHGSEWSNFPGRIAIDWLSDGASGHAPNNILASQSGAVSYRCDNGSPSTAIIIGDFLYAHLLRRNNYSVGQWFNQHDSLGALRVGSFDDGKCGHATQRSWQYHVHWAFPNQDITVSGWTLNRSSSQWRRGSEMVAVNQWLQKRSSATCSAPSLLSPGDGETVHERHVRLDWAAPQCSGLRGYTLHITNGSDPENGIIEDTGVGPDEYTYDFPHDGTFYWHVAAWSGDNRGPWASRRIVIDTSQPPPSNCSINADQIALFMDDDYRGRCVVKNVGEYPNPGAIGLPNDSISSVKVGSNVKAVLCKHDGFNDCETFERDDNHLGDNHIGNDQVSSVKVERRASSCAINADQVALFEHDNFRGRCVVKGIGDYPNPSAMGFPNDTASSIRIGSNVKAILCKHDGFNDCETFEHDDSHLGDNHIGNDQLSSLKVQRRTQSSPAKPRMKSPQDGATISQGTDVVLDWDPSSNATEYAAEYKGPDGRIHNSGHQSATEWNIGRLSPGTYHWHVEAYNQGGSQWSGWTTEWSFRVLPPAPSANFDAQPLNGQAPLTVRFHIITTDNMSSCTWHYGDGQTGHSCDPYHEHTYTRAGRYTVRLDVSGPGGSNSKTRTNYISVSSNSVTSTPTPTPTRTRRPISPTATATPTPTPTTRPSVGELRFSGRVIDYNGRPLSKFGYIQVWGSNLSNGSDTERWLANLTTDNNGNFSWTAPANHRYRYYFLHPHPINNWTSYKVIAVIPGSRGEIWREEWIRYPIVKLGNGSYDGNIFTLSQNGRRATATPTPTATPSIPTEAWLGEYFDNASLQGRPKLVRSDKDINFDWKESSPAPGLPPDHFSVRWVRRIDFSAGNYTFTIGRDDGARLWIDGRLILDEWKQGREEHTVQKELSEGEHILRFEMYEHEGWAMAKLTWRKGDTTPPSGNFTEPASNAEVSAPVWLRANVHDDPSGSGIDYVKFTSNGTGRWREIARDRTPPYEVRWDMASVPNGRKFMIGMEIYDKAGNRTNRIRWITKRADGNVDTTPPSGNFTEPASNAEVSAPVWLRANVHDDPSGSGIDYVKFTSNGTGRWREIARDRTPPYEVRWDMAGVPNGRKFMIGMEIYDKAGNRTNRIRWITKQEFSVSPDIYEPDNDANAAKWISVNGYPGRHNFHVRHDEDWVKFVLSPGTYVMETFELSPSVDTVIELYKSGHVEPIASNDDSNGLASRIEYTVDSSGIYLIRIRSFSTGHTGENSFYRIHVIPSSISDQNSENNDGKTKDTR